MGQLAAPPDGEVDERYEFVYDDLGVDSVEFVELYNATPAAIAIGGWRVEGTNDNGGPDNVTCVLARWIE